MNAENILTAAMNQRLALTFLVLMLVLVMTDIQEEGIHAAVRNITFGVSFVV